jgi:cell division protein FtsB
MWTKHRKRRDLGRFVLPLFTVCFVSYFGYHSLSGAYGMRARETHDAEIIHLTAELRALTSQRTALEKRAALLSNGTIERDMLDESARLSLNMARDDEIVILLPRSN